MANSVLKPEVSVQEIFSFLKIKYPDTDITVSEIKRFSRLPFPSKEMSKENQVILVRLTSSRGVMFYISEENRLTSVYYCPSYVMFALFYNGLLGRLLKNMIDNGSNAFIEESELLIMNKFGG